MIIYMRKSWVYMILGPALLFVNSFTNIAEGLALIVFKHKGLVETESSSDYLYVHIMGGAIVIMGFLLFIYGLYMAHREAMADPRPMRKSMPGSLFQVVGVGLFVAFLAFIAVFIWIGANWH
jgi:hypothetical protein